MEDIIVEVIRWRSLEKILSILVGGASIIAGWHLFLRGVIQEQSAELETQSATIRLQKVGPGVFFALFGAFLVFQSATSQAVIGSAGTSELQKVLAQAYGSGPTPPPFLAYSGNQPSANSLRMAHAMADLSESRRTILDSLTASSVPDETRKVISNALSNLSTAVGKRLVEVFPGELRAACIEGLPLPDGYNQESCASLFEHLPNLNPANSSEN